jgi:diaminopimelate epimerase
MDFAKLHALGNDFLVMRVDAAGGLGMSLSALARNTCDRRRGVGADGVVFYQPTAGDQNADFSSLVFNADGSKAEISGNGIRCLAAFLHHSSQLQSQRVRIRTVAGIRSCVLRDRQGRTYSFETSMGVPVTVPAHIPALLGSGPEPLIRHPLQVGNDVVPVTVVSMGNPHCSTFWPDVEQAPVESLGPLVEAHSAFPKRTNVEFIQVLDSHNLRVRFWERGVGRTLASGTGSCAAAVAAILRNLVSTPVHVQTEGGELLVAWDPPSEVLLTGTAGFICSGDLADDIVHREMV